MPIAFALALAAAVGAGEGVEPAAAEAPPPPSLPYRSWIVSLSHGPEWLGGRLGVDGLASTEVIAKYAASTGFEVLRRFHPRLALGAYAEWTGVVEMPESTVCGDLDCHASYTRFGALGRWSLHRSARLEGWASAGAGRVSFDVNHGTLAGQTLALDGWELAATAGLDFAATRRIGLGIFASASSAVLDHFSGGEWESSLPSTHWAVRTGLRGVVHVGSQSYGPPRPPQVSRPRGTALFAEGSMGGAWCGFCGQIAGVAVKARSGPVVAGVFGEMATIPDSGPEGSATSFLGGFAGGTANVGRLLRVALTAETGVQWSVSSVEYSGGGEEHGEASVSFAGARAGCAMRFLTPSGREGEVGIAAFVRQPLRSACVSMTLGCERMGTSGGVVVQGSIALLWRGTVEAPAATPPVTPP